MIGIALVDDMEYQLCCDIAEKLNELDTDDLCQLVINLSFNFPKIRGYIIRHYYDLVCGD